MNYQHDCSVKCGEFASLPGIWTHRWYPTTTDWAVPASLAALHLIHKHTVQIAYTKQYTICMYETARNPMYTHPKVTYRTATVLCAYCFHFNDVLQVFPGQEISNSMVLQDSNNGFSLFNCNLHTMPLSQHCKQCLIIQKSFVAIELPVMF